VIKVYDGDTLTLQNKSRVRLVGIDTPEINPKPQPFAQEAKQFLSDSCLGKDIYLSYEPGGDKTDHYGRIVAWVWVRVPTAEGGYLNVNEGLVAEGLASFYNPGTSAHQNQNKMLALQKAARLRKAGKWVDFQDSQVLKTRNGRCYHCDRGCTHLKRSKNLIPIKQSEALDKGLSACRGCHE